MLCSSSPCFVPLSLPTPLPLCLDHKRKPHAEAASWFFLCGQLIARTVREWLSPQAIGSLHRCRRFSLRRSYKFLSPAKANVSSQLESAGRRQTISSDFPKFAESSQEGGRRRAKSVSRKP